MQLSGDSQLLAVVASYHSWWQSLGVDCVVEEQAIDWLATPIVVPTAVLSERAAVQNATKAEREPKPQTDVFEVSDETNWPSSLQQLIECLQHDRSLPGTQFGPNVALPVGKANPDIMVIGDIPDEADINAGHLAGGTQGNLLRAMLRAIGFGEDDIFVTSLALTRPASGEIPEATLPSIIRFALHQIKLVQPKAILLLGSTVSKALLGAEIAETRGSLQKINHDGQKVAVISTYHPRTVLAGPSLKREVWQDLQMILKRDLV